MAQFWPGFLIIAGMAFIVLFLAEPSHEVGLLGFGLAVILAGAGGLAFTHGLVGADILKWWPLLLVVVGLISLVGTVVRMVRRE
jgi:hypothetical protein